jgi:predicted nucleic acid-binding Zn ribbon protein
MSPRRPTPPGRDRSRPAVSESPAGDRGDRAAGVERLGDLLPAAARGLGLEEQLELSAAMQAWDLLVSEHVPQAAGSCRLTAFSRGVATVSADQPIVAQELRLRSAELTAALRSAMRTPVRELQIVVRNV